MQNNLIRKTCRECGEFIHEGSDDFCEYHGPKGIDCSTPRIIERFTDSFGTLYVKLLWDTGEVQLLSRDEGDHAAMTDDLKAVGVKP